jgi:SAM-dependent methyltransferase
MKKDNLISIDSSVFNSADKNDSWNNRVNYGNLESNLLFLQLSAVLEKKHRILEIGSGNGSMLSYLISNGYNVIGCDIDPQKFATSTKLYGSLPYELLDTTSVTLPFENCSFDAILSFDVFEHIPDSDLHLGEVSRLLKPNGVYLLQTPNKWTNSIFETIRWRSFTSWKVGHCSLHSKKELIKRFDSHGFEVKFYSIPIVNVFFKRKIKQFLGYFGLLAIKIINPDRLPMCLTTNFFVKATKR